MSFSTVHQSVKLSIMKFERGLCYIQVLCYKYNVTHWFSIDFEALYKNS